MTRINMTDEPGGAEQWSHQEKLAFSLVENLGVEGAIHACQANCWDGVLVCVQSFRTKGEAAGA